MIRLAAVLGIGYVLGAKAGRRRYEQIVATYRAVAANPATKAAVDAGRRRIADRVSPDAAMAKFTEIDEQTAVIEPRQP